MNKVVKNPDELSMKKAIEFLSITQTRFYELRQLGIIPDGSQKRQGQRKAWSKKQLKQMFHNLGSDVAKPFESTGQVAANKAFNMCINQ